MSLPCLNKVILSNPIQSNPSHPMLFVMDGGGGGGGGGGRGEGVAEAPEL